MTSQKMRPAIYLCPTEHCPHLLQLAVGLLPLMADKFGRVGIFRPIVGDVERDPLLTDAMAQTQAYGELQHWGASAAELLANPSAALAQIIERYDAVAGHYDAVLVLGSEYDCSLAPVEYAWNLKVSTNIDVPLTIVVPSAGGVEATKERIAVAIDEAKRNFAQVQAVITPCSTGAQLSKAGFADADLPVFVVQEILGHDCSFGAALSAMGAKVVAGPQDLAELMPTSVVSADMTLANLLPQIAQNSVVVFSADRAEIGLGLVVGAASKQFALPAVAIAAGGWPLEAKVVQLWNKLAPKVPLLQTSMSAKQVERLFEACRNAVAIKLSAVQREEAKRHFARDVDLNTILASQAAIGRDGVVTPLMFEHRLLERARLANQHIVLPEGEEPRILKAADRLLAQRICRLTLLGDPVKIRAKAAELGLDIGSAEVIDPQTSELREKFAATYAELRAKKGVTLEQARERVADVSYFGTMMVREGLADGMVSGSVNTTAHTIRPSLEVIKTKPGVSVVSSVFLMCLADKVLVFGDCAVNPNPTPQQVADIAITSAATAKQFGVDPRVALLSYSTGTSGTGPDVDQTIEATKLVKERAPELLVDGPLQYDAAVEPSVARTKLPDSPVAGKATVLIFPDLQTGNNTYKAVQRSAGALAIGPVLQGLNKPVNDLSRGALVSDIVNTVAITAIQAGME